MASVLVLATLAALLAVGGAALHTVITQRSEVRRRVHERLSLLAQGGVLRVPTVRSPQHPIVVWIDAFLRRAGIEPQRWHGVTAAFLFVLLPGIGAHGWGPLGAVGMGLGGLALLAGFLVRRTRRRREQILELLPSFLDHVVRAVHTGSSLPNSLIAATEESQEPIRGVFARVVRQTRLGVSLEDATEQAADLYSLRELKILALTVRVSQRYGGSVREVLGSIVTMIRQRDRTRREFKAMTGETRLSAAILAALPALLAVYVIAVNPDYIGHMWGDPAGRVALGISGGLQALGTLVLWRMVKSV